MSRKSTSLLTDTAGQISPVGNKVFGAAYYDSPTLLHTIVTYNVNFTGRLILEASLAQDPASTDWFEVKLDKNSNVNYVQYTSSTGIFYFTVQGNYVWLRARIDRSYLVTPADPAHGSVSKVLLNF